MKMIFFNDKQISRASSPENDFVDVESTDNRPQSSASGNSQRPSTSTGLPITPETKRIRGRPRKFKENSEEGMQKCISFKSKQYSKMYKLSNLSESMDDETWSRTTPQK